MAMSTNQVLTIPQLQRLAPSIFAQQEKGTLSDKYNFIPTIDVVKELGHKGWLPVKALQNRANNDSNEGYQKHMIRFRNFDEGIKTLAVGDTFLEMVLSNSHNGLSAFVFNLGLYRLACSNGMVVSEKSFNSLHIRHNSYEAKQIGGITADIIERAPGIAQNVEKMKVIELTKDERGIFAQVAKGLRFENPDQIETEDVLSPRRSQDARTDLWHTFNVVQENLIKGNISYTGTRNGRPSHRHTKEVKSIDGNTKLNQALWELAEKMAELKSV
jgi:hypothetical protein